MGNDVGCQGVWELLGDVVLRSKLMSILSPAMHQIKIREGLQ